jgi:hypothetical protein
MKTKTNVCLMRRVLLIALAALTIHYLPAATGQERGQGVRLRIGAATSGQEIELYGASYALVIGVSDYTNGWHDLPGVSEDLPVVKIHTYPADSSGMHPRLDAQDGLRGRLGICLGLDVNIAPRTNAQTD